MHSIRPGFRRTSGLFMRRRVIFPDQEVLAGCSLTVLRTQPANLISTPLKKKRRGEGMRPRVGLLFAFLFALTGIWLVPIAGRITESSTRRPSKPSGQASPAPVFGVANDFAVSVPVRDLPAAGPVDPPRESDEGELN